MIDNYGDTPEVIEVAQYTKEDLALQLAHALSDTVTGKFLTHGYHWNVVGPDFKEMHAFFSEIYSDLDGSIDGIAEQILQLGFDAPYLPTDFVEIACIKEERIASNDVNEMLTSSLRITETIKAEFTKVFDIANALDIQDIANSAADRIGAMSKWSWQLKATLGIR